MNNEIETLAKEAAQRAKGEVSMIDVPQSEGVVARRRSQHRTRAFAATALAVLVLGGGAAAIAVRQGHSKQSVNIAQEPKVPARVLDQLRSYLAGSHAQATYADWVLTTFAKATPLANPDASALRDYPVYFMDVPGFFVEFCSHGLVATCRNGYATSELIALDAAGRIAPVAFPGRPVDLSKLGPVHRVTLARSTLAYREVLGLVPYAGTTDGTCKNGALLTPPNLVAVSPQVVLPDRKNTVCYLLGPVLYNAAPKSAEPVVDVQTNEWVLNVHYADDGFVTKVATPNVGKQIAIVVDGVVQSAPVVNAGITGRDVTISGSASSAFSETEARNLVAALLGIDPDQVPMPKLSPPTTKRPRQHHPGLYLGGVTKPDRFIATSHDVTSVVARSTTNGWVVDVTFTDAAWQRLRNDKLFGALVEDEYVDATTTASGVELAQFGSSGRAGTNNFQLPGMQWSQDQANTIVQQILAAR